MRDYTDLYFKAMNAEARPLMLAFVGTNYGLRCFSKHYPTEDQIGTTLEDIFEWDARVLNWGDYRQAASQQGDNILQMLVESEMSAYTLECDNADGYFTEIASREIFINAPLYLYQGFDYPSFVFSDFLPIFFGRITDYDYSYTHIFFHAEQSITAEPPDDPLLDLTVTYVSQFDGS